MIVGEARKETLRSHHDLEKDSCKYYKKACKVREEGRVVSRCRTYTYTVCTCNSIDDYS